MPECFSLGYGGRTFEEFLQILQRHWINCVGDVRSWPTSKWEIYKKENLLPALEENNIHYVHLKALGGYRRGGYEKYMETDRYKQGINKLLDLINKYTVGIMCVETHPSGCHRRFICQTLTEENVQVTHILKKGKTLPHKEYWEQYLKRRN